MNQSLNTTAALPRETAASETLDGFLAGVERRAYRMAVIATGNREDALDCVQDAMLRLAGRYGDRPSGEWPLLFHRILQNRLNDWHRRRKLWGYWQRISGGAEDEPEPPGPAYLEPDAQVANAGAVAAVEAALRQLPLRQQQAFLLRAWEGLDVAATAEAMGCSTGSVKTHFSRAVHALRGHLEDHWP